MAVDSVVGFVGDWSLYPAQVPITFMDGSASSPGITFADDTDTGFYRIGADQLGAAVDGNLILAIIAAGLQITAGLSLLFGAIPILVDDPAGTLTLSNIDALDATTIATIDAAANHYTDSDAVSAIEAGATVIGGVTPAAGTFTEFTSTGIDDNATETAMTISAAEAVGFGNVPAHSTLGYRVIVGAMDENQAFLQFINQNTGDAVGDGMFIGNDNISAYIWQRENLPLALAANNTEFLRVTAAGDIGIVSGKKLNFDGLVATGNTYIVESSADVLELHSGGLALTLTAGQAAIFAGAIFAGHTAPLGTPATTDGQFQLVGTNAVGDSSLSVQRFDATSGDGPNIEFVRSAGTSPGVYTAVADGYNLGILIWGAADGSDARSSAAFIQSKIDGAVSSNTTPGTLILATNSGGPNASESLRITATKRILATSLGLVGTPTWSFLGDPNTGMWSSGADILNFSTGGVEALEIDASQNAIFAAMGKFGSDIEVHGHLTITDGGTVTQQTDKSTGVELNTHSGQITMNAAQLNVNDEVSFVVTNMHATALDVVVINHGSAGTAGAYLVACTNVSSGSFVVTVSNISGGNISEAIVLNYVLLGGTSST